MSNIISSDDLVYEIAPPVADNAADPCRGGYPALMAEVEWLRSFVVSLARRVTILEEGHVLNDSEVKP